jgi:hypothetical protein
MPTYLVLHVEKVPANGEKVTAEVTIVDGADQTSGFKEGARTLGEGEGVYAQAALTNVTAKRVKRLPPQFEVTDL